MKRTATVAYCKIVSLTLLTIKNSSPYTKLPTKYAGNRLSHRPTPYNHIALYVTHNVQTRVRV